MIYAAGCVIGFLFVLFVLKETAGQSLDDFRAEADKQQEKVNEANETMSSRC